MLQPQSGLGVVSVPPGYSIGGSCAGGNYLLETPTGNQCLSDAAITAMFTSTPVGTPEVNPKTGTTMFPPLQAVVMTGNNPLVAGGTVATDGSAPASPLSSIEAIAASIPLWEWLAVAVGAVLLTRK